MFECSSVGLHDLNSSVSHMNLEFLQWIGIKMLFVREIIKSRYLVIEYLSYIPICIVKYVIRKIHIPTTYVLGMFRLTETENSVNRCFGQNRNRLFTSKKTETEKLKMQ